MVGRGELTDQAWTQIAPWLPANGKRGGQWRNYPTIINGILIYPYPRCQRSLRPHRILHTIPERCDEQAWRAQRPSRPLQFDTVRYKRRNMVERCLNRLKQWRGIPTCSVKRAVNFRAVVAAAATML